MSRADRNGLRNDAILFAKRAVAERASIGVFEQQGTTRRAYMYHWSVLRCGSSSEERRNVSTIAFTQNITVATCGKCRVSGNPRLERYFSPCATRFSGISARVRYETRNLSLFAAPIATS